MLKCIATSDKEYNRRLVKLDKNGNTLSNESILDQEVIQKSLDLYDIKDHLKNKQHQPHPLMQLHQKSTTKK